MITQEYFDEVFQENVETFELSEEEALQETLEQLQQQQQQPSQSILQHLTLTPPTTEQGQRVRAERTALCHDIQVLSVLLQQDEVIQQQASDCVTSIRQILQLQSNQEDVSSRIEISERDMYRHLFVQQRGVSTLLQLWDRSLETETPAACTRLVVDTIASLVVSLPNAAEALKEGMHTAFRAWLQTYRFFLSTAREAKVDGILVDLLKVAYTACRRCEPNKEKCIKVTLEDDTSVAQLLVKTLELSCTMNEDLSVLASWTARLITVLCTFDDFSGTDMPVQASQQCVRALAKAGALSALHRLLKTEQEQHFVCAALRAMAIQDDTVQAIVALGVLDLAQTALSQSIANAADDSPALAMAVVGLFRNVCANDEIKTKLCRDQGAALVVAAMSTWPRAASLQEHACGTLAAMALRRPHNAVRLVTEYSAHVHILQAMSLHGNRVPLVRQGALAIRNLVSRCDGAVRTAVLDAGAERVLRAAGTQPGCHDEVYAAMRDLGLQATLLHVEEDDKTGTWKVSRSREMFGERNPNFRPVYE